MTTHRSRFRPPSTQPANHGKAFLGLLTFLAFVGITQAAQLPICPTTIENDPPASLNACGALLTVGANLGVSTIATGTLAYNGSDSTFGIVNNSNSVISSLFLQGGDITNFTANGIRTYISANGVAIPPPPSPLNFMYESYYGPANTFSQIDQAQQSLLVDFTGGLAPGTATYFSLAGDPATDVAGLTGPNGSVSVSAAAVPEPSTSSLAAIAATLVAFAIYRRKRKTLSAVRRLAPILFVGVAMLVLGNSARADIVKLPSSPTEEEISTAKADLANGSIVAMIDADPAVFATMFNVTLPKHRNSAELKGPLRYYVIAAHKRENGSVHTFLGPTVKAGQNQLSAVWSSLEKWAEKEQQLQTGETPSPSAWTELSVNTFIGDSYYYPDANNEFQLIVSVYRANSSQTDVDYYMVTQQANSEPHWEGCPFSTNSKCGWYNRTSDFKISLSEPTSKLIDHGPTTVNGSSSAGFSVGGGVSGLGVTGSASFSESWSNSDVNTQDHADPVAGTTWWHDDFTNRFTNWVDSPPDAVKDLFTSYQAAIFTVAASTPTFNVSIDAISEFEFDYYDFAKGVIYDTDIQELTFDIPTSAPSLSTFPASPLRVFPGQSANFNIFADIPNSTGEQLSWSISNIPNFVTLNTTTGAGSQTITVNVLPGATVGSTGTLNIDTNPPTASPNTRSGALKLPVTVVSPSDVPPGVLFTGGLSWTGNPQFSAEVWNPTTGQSSSVKSMSHARYLHTATPIQNNQILIAGGLDDGFNLVGQTEIYSEATQSFSLGPQLQVPRAWHTATFLNDGTVLLAGGQDGNGNALASAEIYDPVTNQTTPTAGSMITARMKHSATLLRDGTVFIYGGTTSVTNTGSLYTSEIYNPQTKTFSQLGSLSYGYQSQAAALLNTDQLLLVTGYADAPGNMTLCTGGGSACSQSQTPADVAGGSALIPLPNTSGTLALLAGGDHSFLFADASSTFGQETSMLEQRSYPNAVLIQNTNTSYDGSVLVAGGVTLNTGSSNGTTVEVNNPQNNVWQAAGALTTARSQGTMTLVGAIPITSTVQLSSSLNPSVSGNQVIFTAAVSGASVTATGTVTFYDGTTLLGTSHLNNGSAQFQISSLSVGSHNITAVYSGGVGVLGGTSNAVTQVVNPVPVTPVFTNLSSQTITYGTLDINFSGQLSAPGPIYPGAGETVRVSFGGTSALIPVAANGVFNFNHYGTSGFSVGTYPITYSYVGDVKLKPAQDTSTSLTITPGTPVFRSLSASQSIIAAATVIHLTGQLTYQQTYIPHGNVLVTINNIQQSSSISDSQSCAGCFSLDFNTSSIPASTTPYPITYSYAAAGNYTAATDRSTSLTVNAPAPTTTALTSSLNPSSFGASVTFTGTVASQNGTPTGSVFFYDGQTQLGSAVLSGGSAKFATTSLSIGTHAITAAYDGGNTSFARSTSAVLTQTVNKLATVFSGLSPSQTVGYETPSLILKGTISAPNNTYPPTTESVQVTIGGVNGTAGIGQSGAFWVSFPTASLAVGTYPITYSYVGDANFAPVSDSSTTLTIGKTTPVFSNLTPSQTIKAGMSPVQLSGKLTQGTAIATGSVSISINGQSTPATISSDGTFSMSVNTSAIPGSATPFQITYSYAGNTNFNPASDSSTTLTVTSTASATVLTSSLNPSRFGQAVTFTATVTASNGAPTGTVAFLDGTETIGSGTLTNGSATYLTTALAAGSHAVTAVYGGSGNFGGSKSATVTQIVNQAVATLTVSSSQNPSRVGSPITFTANVSGSGGTPTGTVTFKDGTTVLGTSPLNGGVSTFVTSALASGTHPITASYGGDSSYGSVASAPFNQVVNGGLVTPTAILTVNKTVAKVGDVITFQVAVSSPNGPVPTGSITVSDSTNANNRYGSAPLINGVGTVSNSQIPAGTYTVVATYGGDGGVNYLGTQSNVVAFTINPAD